ncbi:MAG: P1 family peptidase [Flavobacteriaceae bacterium]
MNPKSNNDITDIAGIRVGSVHDGKLCSGVTVVMCDWPMVAAVDVRGGGPGTRETDLLAPQNTVSGIDAIAISGGSAFGLDAASGVQAALKELGRGFQVGPVTVPIVPGVILFDLVNGGNKDWGRFPPYREMGYNAAFAAGRGIALGSVGAGYGATTATLRGGLGSVSAQTGSGFTVGALAAVNAAGSATIGDGPHFWAAPYERGEEFGGLGMPGQIPDYALLPRSKMTPMEATTPAVVATDARLTKAEALRVAIMAQDGMARALHPVHSPLDGDTVFVVATGEKELADPLADILAIGTLAAHCLARAIARGVYEAGDGGKGASVKPAWRERFG